MTKTKTEKPIDLISGPYTLELSFDAAQITQSLRFAFYQDYDKGPKLRIPYNMRKQGLFAGSFHFPQNAEINIVIVASVEHCKGELPLELNITNCTIVSIKPADVSIDLNNNTLEAPKPDDIEPPKTQGLSLFDYHNACTAISEWGLAQEVPPAESPEGVKQVSVKALNPLIVRAGEGQWKMSGYLSALYNSGKGPVVRLFYFDPESSAGSGDDFGPP